MRASIDYQRGELHRQPVVEVRTEARTGVRANTTACYERRQVAELAEATVGAPQTPPLCERNL
ncbi:hypothetical protein [Pseudomonas sp.]|uniref:hypothetical protein n=1 Tax=Pseudomonas sp. TaxID=306 RepID=UPI002605C73E|nr:hypothetical protein [Pseudomonas sp.]